MEFPNADSRKQFASHNNWVITEGMMPCINSRNDVNLLGFDTEEFKASLHEQAVCKFNLNLYQPQFSSENGGADAAKVAWSNFNENVIRAPFDHLLSIQGKGNRKRFIAAINKLLAVSEENVSVIGEVIEILHTASLLIDDIQDNSKLRRGYPSTHTIFGEAQTINSANYAYFLALKSLHELGNPQAAIIFTEEIINLHRGQGMDLFWRDSLICPTEEEYLEMVKNKTGGLFRLAIRLLQCHTPIKKDLIPLGEMIGQIYQMRDDYQNLRNDVYTHEKGFCEDLTEGKFSFPIIHSIRENTSNTLLMSILRQRTDNSRLKQHALSYMERTGSFAYTKKRISEMIAQATKLVKDLNTSDSNCDQIMEILELLAV